MVKNYYLLFYLFVLVANLNYGQTTAIPDTNFEQALIDLSIDSDDTINGEVLTSDISSITTLDISNKNISDLTGIGGFENLIEFNCSLNFALSELDLSNNLKLEKLICNVIDVSNLDFSNNVALKEIECSSNIDILTLNISGNTNLESFIMKGGSSINLNLDFSNNTNLKHIDLTRQEFNSLNVSGAIALETLILSSCPSTPPTLTLTNPNLNNLQVDNTFIKYLTIQNTKITELDVSTCTELEELDCNNNSLTSLKLNQDSGNPFPSRIYGTLIKLNCSNNNLTLLDLTDNRRLLEVDCSNNNIESIEFSPFDWYTGNAHPMELTSLDCSFNNLTTLSLIFPVFLSELNCSNNNLTSIELAKVVNVQDQLHVPSLSIINCENNNLSVFDNFEVNTNLKELNVKNNNFNISSIQSLINLEVINYSFNNLVNLDLSENTNLTQLDCSNNNLEYLNLQNGTNLKNTYFKSLNALNATNNPNLKCIQVDNATAANNGDAPYDTWLKDTIATYSEDCQSTLGVDDEILDKLLTVFPNPVHHILGIESKTLQVTKVEIYSVLGKKIKEVYSNFDNINLSAVSSGIYFTRIYSEDGVASRKILKN